MATGKLPATQLRLPVRGSHGTGDDVIGVSGMYYGVTIAMKGTALRVREALLWHQAVPSAVPSA